MFKFGCDEVLITLVTRIFLLTRTNYNILLTLNLHLQSLLAPAFLFKLNLDPPKLLELPAQPRVRLLMLLNNLAESTHTDYNLCEIQLQI